jgi:hypothetical protein
VRRRTLTENIGCYVTKAEIAALKAHAKAQRMTVSDYLRQAAVQPLLQAQAVAEVSDDPDAA